MKLLDNNHDAPNLARISNIVLDAKLLKLVHDNTEEANDLLNAYGTPNESSLYSKNIPLNDEAMLPDSFTGVVAANHSILNIDQSYDGLNRKTKLTLLGGAPLINVDLLHVDDEPIWHVKPHLSKEPVWWYTHSQVIELVDAKLRDSPIRGLMDFVPEDNQVAVNSLVGQLSKTTRDRKNRNAYSVEEIMIQSPPYPDGVGVECISYLENTFTASVNARMITEEGPGTVRNINVSILSTALLGDSPITTELVYQQAGRSGDGSVRQGISAILSSPEIPESSLRLYGLGIKARANSSARVAQQFHRATQMLKASTGVAPIDLAS